MVAQELPNVRVVHDFVFRWITFGGTTFWGLALVNGHMYWGCAIADGDREMLRHRFPWVERGMRLPWPKPPRSADEATPPSNVTPPRVGSPNAPARSRCPGARRWVHITPNRRPISATVNVVVESAQRVDITPGPKGGIGLSSRPWS